MATSNNTPRTIEIQLTRGYIAIIDEQDADLNDYKWHSHKTTNREYAQRNIPVHQGSRKQKIKQLHIFIMERMIGRVLFKAEYVDHIDNNSLNNKRDNLRLCTHAQNDKNKKRYSNNKSGLKGVYERSGKYRAQIQVDGKKIMLGTYDTSESAYKAYCEAAKKYHGEFARFE